ncbi:serine/threonine protein kinase [Labilithrix luteola]|uniref:Serine/threonine protein kinase n=1 Tax=Labilithrix luteola TaxID=1391654 RepID=A0A0K1PQX2_9BACT|nr:serine/threonine-protein kinase [Labilithrix luteola]AKU95940.1 serine/threonine protein kinase [Labilithrix luteola]
MYRVGEVDGHPYIAYEFVAGQSLDKVQKPVAWETALRLGLGLARGLAAAHATGILHRDIKPGNAVLGERGEIKLLDFGLAKLLDSEVATEEVAPLSVHGHGRPNADLAKADDGSISTSSTERVRVLPEGLSGKPDSIHERNLTRPGTLMGTPAYLSPELWWGEAASPRSDVFALGLVLYELIAGALPHAHLEGEEMAFAIIDRDFPGGVSRRAGVARQDRRSLSAA